MVLYTAFETEKKIDWEFVKDMNASGIGSIEELELRWLCELEILFFDKYLLVKIIYN